MLLEILNTIDSAVWGPWLLILLLGVGVLFTIRLGLIQITSLPRALKLIFFARNRGDGDIDSFKALCTALAATVGPITSNTLINDIFFLLWISIIVLHVYGNNLIICKFLIIFYHLGIKEANLSLTLTKINVKNEKTGLLFLYWAVTITVQIENNFKNAVSK